MGGRLGKGIVGRDHPAGVLRAEIARAADSHGGLVLVTGESGIGKTTLVTDAADEARRRGALVVGGSCWDSESSPGYWPWVQVLRALRRAGTPDEWSAVRAVGGAPLAALLGEAPPTDRDDAEPAQSFALYDAVTGALVAACQSRPVVVVLDDLHWADPASLRLLEFAAQHTWFERLLLIGTYRDIEVEAPGHRLRPLLLPLLAKASTLTLTGLDRDEVGVLIARTSGLEPERALVDEVHRRTGGNPFFVEQTARLWRADGAISGIAPGVSAAVGRRLSLLPERVVEVLTVAAVLGREFHRQVLAACATAPAAEIDRLLDAAVAARLVVTRGDGAFGFAHDLVRETLYEALGDAQRRRRHAAVIRAVDPAGALADRLPPADLARHAYLAGGDLEPGRAVDLLVAAARDAGARLATEESAVHYRRALELVDGPRRRAMIALEFGSELHHLSDRAEAWRHIDEAARIAREFDEPDLLGRVAVTAYRHTGPHSRRVQAVADLVREAHARAVGGSGPALDAAPLDRLVAELIEGSERRARHGRDDEALAFSLWARHDTMWGPGTAREREAVVREIAEVARRSGDRDGELFAASLRWVTMVEQGDPRYHDQLHTFVAMGQQLDIPRYRLATVVDRAIIAAFRGEFDRADTLLDEVPSHGDQGHPDFLFMTHHLRWARLALQGRFDEMDAVLAPLSKGDHPYIDLIRAITAIERADVEPAVRHVAEIEASGQPYPGSVRPLWLRLRAQVAAATGDPAASGEVRGALAPHRDEWVVSMYGCDISGPASLWIAMVDAAQGRWDDAVAGFTAARESADRLQARPWSVIAGAGLSHALAARGAAGDATTAEAVRKEVTREATRLGMGHVLARLRSVPAGPETGPAPAFVPEFRREGAVWRLGYAGAVVHLPDAKGLRDLHLLLSQPDVDIPAAHLLDPAAGPELVAARQMGGDPILDDEAKVRYRRHLAQMDEAIDRAAGRGDRRRAASLEAERVALLDELRAAGGLAGRSRRLGDQAERARKTVTARIRDTLRRLDERHPTLAAHLRDAVSTGSTCRYAPPEPVAWRLH
jgi:hypothetical protein